MTPVVSSSSEVVAVAAEGFGKTASTLQRQFVEQAEEFGTGASPLAAAISEKNTKSFDELFNHNDDLQGEITT